MDYELQLLAEKINAAQIPEEIFGALTEGLVQEKLEQLTKTYRPLVKKTHPEAYVGDIVSYTLAQNVFSKLSKLKSEAEKKIKQGTYGQASKVVIGKFTYKLSGSQISGDISSLYLTCHGKEKTPVVLKISNNSEDNELLESEAKHLEILQDKLKDQPWCSCLPKVYQSVYADLGYGDRKRVNLLDWFEGFYDCRGILKYLPQGVNGQTIAWMFKRLLLLLDWSHKSGVLHGAVLPPHVLFYPDNDGETARDLRKHSVRLVDWCYSVSLNATSSLKAWCPDYKAFYPPEVMAKKAVSPATDLYMACKTAVYLVGGDVTNDTMPSRIPTEMQNCIKAGLVKDQKRRPNDAGLYFERFAQAVKKSYGPSKYHEFILPR